MSSETYADLGGGVGTDVRLSVAGHRHRFAPLSGWCAFGIRDDGQIAEYSPAWRATRKEQTA